MTRTSAPNRTLRLRDKPTGPDVRRLQKAVGVAQDGEYGPETRRATHTDALDKGYDPKHLHAGLTVSAQRLILGLARPTAIQKIRAARRARERPLRVKALEILLHEVGVMERGGNNRGPRVEQIITYAGGDIGEPWCVDFGIWGYGHAGSTVLRPGAPRAVASYPEAGVRVIKGPQPGDAIAYSFDHWGTFVRWIDRSNGVFEAVEGNTGPTGARSDSPTGGDGVYLKTRYVSQVRCFLRVDR